MRRTIFECCLVTIWVSFFGANCLARQDSQDSSSHPYELLLNKVFPWPEDDLRSAPVTVTLRFGPSFHPESQIILRFDDQARAAVEYLKAAVSISEFLYKTRTPPTLDRSTAEKVLAIERRTLRVESAQARVWLDGFWDSLARSPKQIKEEAGTFQVDGTRYELRVFTGLATWYLIMSDVEVADKANGRVPVVQWMNSVRIAVDSLH